MENKPQTHSIVLTQELVKKHLPKFKRHDDLIIINQKAWDKFVDELPIKVAYSDSGETPTSQFCVETDELAYIVCQCIQRPICKRIAIDKGVSDNDYRSPNIELILGDSTIVTHKENGLVYKFDISKCMFSFGNINEKIRMGQQDCSKEVVVDLFAGIGYFTLPLLVHSKARHLYACEWNPDAVAALRENLNLNNVRSDRYTVFEGDNRKKHPTDVAQRVILGILPSCSDWMITAFECVNKKTGAILHCHELTEMYPSEASISTNTTHASASPDISTKEKYEDLSTDLSTPVKDSSKDTDEQNSPTLSDTSHVFVEKPDSSSSSSGDTRFNETTSICSSEQLNIDSLSESMSERESSYHKAKYLQLISKIDNLLQSEKMQAKLLGVNIIKSYAPSIYHVVYDIELKPPK